MKNVMSRTSLMAVALVTLTSAAFAQGPGPRGRRPDDGGGRPGFGQGPEQLAERLGLSDDQKAQWQSLRERQHDAMKPLFDSARQAHEAFQAALEAAHPDVTSVGQAALAMHAAEKKLHDAQQAAFDEMKSILTPEQREKLEHARERGGPGGPRRGGDAPRSRG